MTRRVVLAAAGDRVALARAGRVAEALQARLPELAVDVLATAARVNGHSAAAARVAGVRAAVLAGQANVAVHDLSDLPNEPAPGLELAAVTQRDDPRDVLVTGSGQAFQYLPAGSRVGVASGRVSAQILRRRSDLAVALVAGSVEAQLRQLDERVVAALVLAAADLAALGWLDRVTEYFDTDLLIPAPGQGALGLEVRAGDAWATETVAAVHDRLSAYAVGAERACRRRLGAAVEAPVGVHAVTDGSDMAIIGLVAWADGTRAARMRWSGPCRPADEVGSILAELLDAAGAQAILSGDYIPRTVRYATRRAKLIEEWEAQNPEREG
jgi:hydroxymethylbilane synthase